MYYIIIHKPTQLSWQSSSFVNFRSSVQARQSAPFLFFLSRIRDVRRYLVGDFPGNLQPSVFVRSYPFCASRSQGFPYCRQVPAPHLHPKPLFSTVLKKCDSIIDNKNLIQSVVNSNLNNRKLTFEQAKQYSFDCCKM